MPEAIALQMEERESKVTVPDERQDPLPVSDKSLTQLVGERNSVGSRLPLLKEIQNR